MEGGHFFFFAQEVVLDFVAIYKLTPPVPSKIFFDFYYLLVYLTLTKATAT